MLVFSLTHLDRLWFDVCIRRKGKRSLDLSGRTAVVAGGTQGIGAATALRFAEAGASVFITGRDEGRGAAVVEELKRAGGTGKTFEFIKADLSLVSEMKEVVAILQEKVGAHGIDYLIQTQGKTANGHFSINSEGHESHFAIQDLSRFALAYLLAKSGTLKGSVLSVCAPSGNSGKAPDVDDIELIRAHDEGKFGFFSCRERDGNVMDAWTGEFYDQFGPSGLRAYHVSPGFVATNDAEHSGLPYPFVLLLKTLMPLLSRTIGNTPKRYADIPVFLVANPKSRALGLEYSNERLKSLEPLWISMEPLKRRLVWQRLVEMVDGK